MSSSSGITAKQQVLRSLHGNPEEIPLYRLPHVGIDRGGGAWSDNGHPLHVNLRDPIQPLSILDRFQAERRQHREFPTRGQADRDRFSATHLANVTESYIK
jgi:hypothetical protein